MTDETVQLFHAMNKIAHLENLLKEKVAGRTLTELADSLIMITEAHPCFSEAWPAVAVCADHLKCKDGFHRLNKEKAK